MKLLIWRTGFHRWGGKQQSALLQYLIRQKTVGATSSPAVAMDAAMKVSTYENIRHFLLYLKGTPISSKGIFLNQIQLQKGHTGSSFATVVDLFSYCISVAAIFIDTRSLSLIKLSLK